MNAPDCVQSIPVCGYLRLVFSDVENTRRYRWRGATGHYASIGTVQRKRRTVRGDHIG